MHKISIPRGAMSIITALQHEGDEAYVVGGCVRDSLLGIEPHDWDICTSANPVKVKAILHHYGIKTVETGIKHGTVTAVISNEEQYEVTTFRLEGNYSDNQYLDKAATIGSLAADLYKRDFTINAIAYNATRLIDPYCGQSDLEHGVISCVGDPNDRFLEDPLRILRALRFAATYQFSIGEKTAEAVHRHKDKLSYIAAERIQSELFKLLLGKNAANILLEYSDVMAVIIPEIKPCIGFEQNSRYHQYTVYEHIVRAVENYTGNDMVIKVALFLHDIGKPQCYTEDKNGGHFHGHGAVSRDLAQIILDRLRLDNKSKSEILELILYHDAVIEPTPKTVRRWLNRIGPERFSKLLEIRMADILAHSESTRQSRINRCNLLQTILDSVMEEGQCFALKDMEIHGRDILSLGVSEGKIVGDVLQHILSLVIADELPNRLDVQMIEAKRYLESRGECGVAEQ